MKRTILILILVHLAHRIAAGNPLNWENCVREMIANSPQLKAAQDSRDKARADMMAKYSPFLPQLTAHGDLGASGSDTDDGYSDSSSVGAGLSLKQTLFSGFRNQAALDHSRAMLIVSEMNLRRVKSDLSYNLRSAFAQLLYSQKFLDLAQAIAARRKDNFNLVELRFEAGREHKGSFLRSRAFMREAEFDVEQARRALFVARRQLAAAMGMQADMPDMEVEGEWRVAEPEAVPSFPEIIMRTPEHIAAEAGLEAAREMLRSARSDYFPTLSASASGERRGETWNPNKNSWNAGLTVSLPVFLGGSRFHGVQSARADLSIAQSELADVDNQLAAILEQKFAAWQDAIDRVKVQEDFAEAAKVRAEIARSQYSNGLISFQDWDTIENDLISQEKAMMASRRDAVVAEAGWQKAIGTGVIP